MIETRMVKEMVEHMVKIIQWYDNNAKRPSQSDWELYLATLVDMAEDYLEREK
jgi:hypothetical protein